MKVLTNFNLHSINLTKLEVKSQGSEVLSVLDVNGSSVSCKAYEDVIWVVKPRRANRAILHVEGTLEGNVVRNYNLFVFECIPN